METNTRETPQSVLFT